MLYISTYKISRGVCGQKMLMDFFLLQNLQKTTRTGEIATARNCFARAFAVIFFGKWDRLAVFVFEARESRKPLTEWTVWWRHTLRRGPYPQKIRCNFEKHYFLRNCEIPAGLTYSPYNRHRTVYGLSPIGLNLWSFTLCNFSAYKTNTCLTVRDHTFVCLRFNATPASMAIFMARNV